MATVHWSGYDDAFVGRADLLKSCVAALRARALLVLSGPPGVGKTRLAATAIRASSSAPRAVLVRLGELSTVAGLLEATADATSLARPDGLGLRALESRLQDHLRGSEIDVVVFDDGSRLPREADAVLAALHVAASCAFIVTSRRRLDAPSTHLDVPPLDTRTSAAQPWSEAGLLLRARAEELARVRLDDDDRDTIHALASRLGGLPLALELAAARLRVLTPHQLLGRSSEVTRVDLDARLAASFEVLGDDARTCLLACSVFRGGFLLEALELVVRERADEAKARPWRVVDALQVLRDHSLLVVDRQDDVYRYDVYSSVRDFAAQRAEQAAEHDGWCDRHATALLAYAEATIARGARGAIALRRERENLRVAFQRAARTTPATAARLALLLSSPSLGTSAESALETIDVALALLDPRASARSPPADEPIEAVRGRLHLRRGALLRYLGRSTQAAEALEEARRAGERAGDEALRAEALAGLGNAAAMTSDWSAARAFIRASIDAHPAPGFVPLGKVMLANTFCNEDDHGHAEPLMREALALAQRGSDEATAAIARLSLGTMLVEVGKLDEAFPLLVECLDRFVADETLAWQGYAALGLARIEQERGRHASALVAFDRALAMARRGGMRRAEGVASYYLGALLLELGELDAAEDRLRTALALLRDACPDHEGAVVSAQAVLAALRGEADVGRTLLAHAEELLSRFKRPMFSAAVRVLRGEPASALTHELRSCSDVRLAERLHARLPVTTRPTWTIYAPRDASWFRRADAEERVSLARRKPLRLVFGALVAERLEHPGRTLSFDALVAVGWPGERLIAAAGRERLYAAVATLRRLGLRDVVEHEGDGYRLAIAAQIVAHD